MRYLAIALLAGCSPIGYAVTDVYQVDGRIYQTKCEIWHDHKIHTDRCVDVPVEDRAPVARR